MSFGTITEEQARGIAAACTDAPAHVRALFLLLPYSRSAQALADDYAFSAAAAWIEAHPEREAGARFLSLSLPQFARILNRDRASAQRLMRKLCAAGVLERIAPSSRHSAPVYAFALADADAIARLEYRKSRVIRDTLKEDTAGGLEYRKTGLEYRNARVNRDTTINYQEIDTPQTPHAPRVAAAPGEEGERVRSFIDQWRIGGADDGNADA